MGRAERHEDVRRRGAPGGDGGTRPPGSDVAADPARRSRAWGVLAVSLALMALVTALTSSAGHRALRHADALDRSRPEPVHRTADGHPGRAAAPGRGTAPRGEGTGLSRRLTDPPTLQGPGRPRPERTGAALPHTSAASAGTSPSHAGVRSNATRPAVQPTAPATPAGAVADAASVGTATAATPTPQLRPTTAVSVSSTGTRPSVGSSSGGTPTPSGTYPGPGTIVAPGTGVSYAAPGGVVVSARATWTGAVDLVLGITCGGGVSVTRTGSSGLSVEVDDSHASGTCTVTLSLGPDARAPVPFTLSIDPAP